jgi:hypothetical protein
MAHTAIRHLKEMKKKKELALAMMTMSQEEFNLLVEQSKALVAEPYNPATMSAADDHLNPIALTVVTAGGNDASADTSREGGEIWEMIMGFSSGKS